MGFDATQNLRVLPMEGPAEQNKGCEAEIYDPNVVPCIMDKS
jgi:hypothetical protein